MRYSGRPRRRASFETSRSSGHRSPCSGCWRRLVPAFGSRSPRRCSGSEAGLQGDVRRTEIEEKALQVLDAIARGVRYERERIELKRDWPTSDNGDARQLAGHANADGATTSSG